MVRAAATLLYLGLPSLCWSIVYRDIKVVADVLMLVVVENMVPAWIGRFVRLAWCLLCGTMLLLEWNIFPESYLFYATLMARAAAASSPQGQAIIVGVCALAVFVALPAPRWRDPRGMVAIIIPYAILLGFKAWPVSEPYLVWLRQPAPRALEVAWTDARRIGTASVASPRYDALSPGHAVLVRWLSAPNRPAKVLILLLESWGETPADLAVIETTLRQTSAAALVASGFTAFGGPTLAGEVRDLCGRSLSFRDVNASLADCLPHQAEQAGYVTSSVHGYEGYFYNRQILYPQIGFLHSWFAPDFGKANRCGGAFDGICDDVVLRRAIALLRAGDRQFVYMMSLSAHEPVAPGLADRNYVRREPAGPLGRRANRALIHLAVDEMRRLSQASRGDLVLYIAGDHNPPGQEEKRDLPPGKVPYLLLRWRR